MIVLRMPRAKAMMLEQGLTTVDVAKMAQLSRANLCECLNGRQHAGKLVCESVSAVLGWGGQPEEVFDTVTLRESD